MKNIFINQVKAGDKVSGLFLVDEKGLAFSQKGAPYLSLQLQDRTGKVSGRVWANAVDLGKKFRKGDVIWIQARAVSFKDAVQFSIMELRAAGEDEINWAGYFAVVKGNVEGMYAELMAIVDQVTSPPLSALLKAFFADEKFVPVFCKIPAAKGFHHASLGGLLEHTLSVAKLMVMAADHYPRSNRDLLIAGGILHDMGKVREFSFQGHVDYSDEGRLLGHIATGLEMLDAKLAAIADFPPRLAMELRHIILSHHGMLEYGSPRRPKTVEAIIVHQLDDLDAKVNAFQEYIDKSDMSESDWTPFHRLFERYIYRGSLTKE
jgi:3'-5' exoribonuclease